MYALRLQAFERLTDLVDDVAASESQYMALRGQFNLQFFLAVRQAISDLEHARIRRKMILQLISHRAQGCQRIAAELNVDRVARAEERGSENKAFGAGYSADRTSPFAVHVCNGKINRAILPGHGFHLYAGAGRADRGQNIGNHALPGFRVYVFLLQCIGRLADLLGVAVGYIKRGSGWHCQRCSCCLTWGAFECDEAGPAAGNHGNHDDQDAGECGHGRIAVA